MLAVLFLRCVILPLKFAFQFDYSGVVLSPFVETDLLIFLAEHFF